MEISIVHSLWIDFSLILIVELLLGFSRLWELVIN
jgi:hypothetical protein